ncbi:MAG: DUF4173 domain-containing protein [Faecalimonas sp.]|nr:DUF4173 domain-containing protein [Faecalimonas sp.]
MNNEKMYHITIRDFVYILALLITSIMLSAFGVFGGFAGGFTVSAILSTVIMSLYLLNKGYRFKLFPMSCFILSIVISINFTVTSNEAVRFFSFAVYMCLTFAWFLSIVQTQTKYSEIGFLQSIFTSLGEMLENLPVMFRSLFVRDQKSNRVLGKVLLGIAASLPALVIILPLLVGSDEAFSGMMGLLLEDTAMAIVKILFGIGIAIFVISYGLSLKKNSLKESPEIHLSYIDTPIIISFLSVISVCYLSYLYSQLAYFFEAFRGFLPDGYEFTVSAYARRGFFEMCTIAAINFVIILLCRLLVKRNAKKSMIPVNVLSTFIGIFTLTIISTALSKMFLYIKSFGMTRLRITTSVFMVFLAIVFIALILRLYIKNVCVAKTAFVAAAIALILLGTVNVNWVVAEYNYTAYKNGSLKDIDVETISELGDEGIPYLIKLTKDSDKQTFTYAKYKLSLKYEEYYNLNYNDDDTITIDSRIYDEVGQYRISRQKAYEQLDAYLKENPNFLKYQDMYRENSDYADEYIW